MTRDARLSALHAAIVGSGPALAKPSGVAQGGPFGLALVHSHVPLVVAEGRVFPGASRVLRARQRAGRRSYPAYAMPRESTLGGRDRRRVTENAHASMRKRVRLLTGVDIDAARAQGNARTMARYRAIAECKKIVSVWTAMWTTSRAKSDSIRPLRRDEGPQLLDQHRAALDSCCPGV